ncbi:MAG: hypothetical protein KGJ86_03485 [Chloroflexota bacterium]|nr:hypothetical protein [Chloroflexota bacterium]
MLQSADQLLNILLFLGKRGGEHTVSGLGRELGLSFSRAYPEGLGKLVSVGTGVLDRRQIGA